MITQYIKFKPVMNVVLDFTIYDNDELFRFHQEMHQSGGGNTLKISNTFQKVNERTYQKNKAIDRHFVVKLNSDLVRENFF